MDNPNNEKYLIHADSKPFFSEKDIKRFSKTVGDDYVDKKQLDLTDEELECMSLTDGAEMCRLYKWFHSQVKPDDTDEKRAASARRLGRIGEALSKKITSADEIYCLYSKITGDPYLYSHTFKENGNYVCTAPNLRLFTRAYLSQAEKTYPSKFFEIKRVSAGDDRKGILEFLTERFYSDGAVGAEINGDYAALPSSAIVSPPDFGNTPRNEIPVTNPALRRWLILSAQMPAPSSENEKLVSKLYYRMASSEAVKARFLVPVEEPCGDRSDSEVLKLVSGEEYLLCTAENTEKDKLRVSIFTDIGKVPSEFKDKKMLSMKLSQLCGTYDIVINPSDRYRSGLIVNSEILENMEKAAGVSRKENE